MNKEIKIRVLTKYTVPALQPEHANHHATITQYTYVDGTSEAGIGNSRSTRWDPYKSAEEAKLALAKEVRRDLEAKLVALKAEAARAQDTLDKLTLFGLDGLVNHAVEYWAKPGTKPEPPKPEDKPEVTILIRKGVLSKFPYGTVSNKFTEDHMGMRFKAVRDNMNYYRLTALATDVYIHIYDCTEVDV
jgi:hypothetical protein